MDFDQLNTFVEVAKHGSFSLAGRKVFRSQSAVSAQIRQLEQEYGEKLFGRMGKTVRLTPAGEVLFEYAERFLSLRWECAAGYYKGASCCSISRWAGDIGSHMADQIQTAAEFLPLLDGAECNLRCTTAITEATRRFSIQAVHLYSR